MHWEGENVECWIGWNDVVWVKTLIDVILLSASQEVFQGNLKKRKKRFKLLKCMQASVPLVSLGNIFKQVQTGCFLFFLQKIWKFLMRHSSPVRLELSHRFWARAWVERCKVVPQSSVSIAANWVTIKQQHCTRSSKCAVESLNTLYFFGTF